MHELSVSSAIVATAARHAAGRRVLAVQVRVGALRQVIPDSLQFYWGIVTRETECEGSALDLELVPARLRCEACATEWAAEQPAFRCPACAEAAVKVLAGNELEVESIEVEMEAQCIA